MFKVNSKRSKFFINLLLHILNNIGYEVKMLNKRIQYLIVSDHEVLYEKEDTETV